ncbi:MAG TPA: LON peptidase substrate-binding domain-containing protein, partial [Gammaproteobacteria bacterium]|nr:LON peptidase substrate-binding domain-containing protein [Gammaproteobacteria bacterium]
METHHLRPDAPKGANSAERQEHIQGTAEASRLRTVPEDAIPIVPVRNLVLFPGVILPIGLGRSMSIAAAQEAARSERPIGIVLQRDMQAEKPGPDALHWVGTMGGILRYVTAPDGAHHIVCQGEQRFRITQFLEGYPYLVGRIERIEQQEVMSKELEAQMLKLKERAVEALQLSSQAPAELIGAIQGVQSASALADLAAHFMDLKPNEKQAVLETFDVQARLDKVLTLLAHRLEVLRLSRDIDTRTQESMGQRQREYLLREQLKTIQRELGEDEGNSAEIAELSKAIADAKMPEEVEKHARQELKRLERMPEAAAEYSMVRGYLEWLIELPWSVTTESEIDINRARKILDEDHYGLDKIKRRIL